MQDDASHLKQEIYDLKQQLLAEQVRHNQIARVYVGTVNIYQQQQQIDSSSIWIMLIVHTSSLARVASALFYFTFRLIHLG